MVAKANKAASNKAVVTLTTWESILASSIAGAITSVASNPLWVVNTRQTTASSFRDANGKRAPPKSFFATLNDIISQEGITALWGGLGPALVLVINPVIQYSAFEQLKNSLLARRALAIKIGGTKATDAPTVLPLSDMDFFWLGALSKLIATGSTYPILTIKSRMQTGQKQGKKYKNVVDGIFAVIRDEGGVQGLYRGILPKLTQSVLTAGAAPSPRGLNVHSAPLRR